MTERFRYWFTAQGASGVAVFAIGAVVFALGAHKWRASNSDASVRGSHFRADSSFDYLDSIDWPRDSGANLEQIIGRFVRLSPDNFGKVLHRWNVLSGFPRMNYVLQDEINIVFSQRSELRGGMHTGYVFIQTPYGPSVRVVDAFNTGANFPYESHVDQLLATCGAAGVPLDQFVQLENETTTLGSVLETSRKRFVLDQTLEWSAIAYAIYQPHEPKWTNRYGDTCTYDSIVDRLVTIPFETGPCFGTHTPYAVSILLNADRSHHFLKHRTRSRAERYLRQVASRLEETQLSTGAWCSNWSVVDSEEGPRDFYSSPSGIEYMLLATGHHLEWINVADASCQPSSGSIKRALDFILLVLPEQMDGSAVLSNERYCAISHCCHVISEILQRRTIGE